MVAFAKGRIVQYETTSQQLEMLTRQNVMLPLS